MAKAAHSSKASPCQARILPDSSFKAEVEFSFLETMSFSFMKFSVSLLHLHFLIIPHSGKGAPHEQYLLGELVLPFIDPKLTFVGFQIEL